VIPAAVLCSGKTNGRQSHGNCIQWMVHLRVKELKLELADFSSRYFAT
jgi:hypothetical protein